MSSAATIAQLVQPQSYSGRVRTIIHVDEFLVDVRPIHAGSQQVRVEFAGLIADLTQI
jgi:hypothetical protein